MNNRHLILLTAFLFIQYIVKAQLTADDLLGKQNTITTTVPILLVAPEARGGAMGDVGAATTPDANSGHWNPAKFAFIDKEGAASFSYTPWLRQLVDGVSISYLSGYKKINNRSAFGASLRFFSLGNINFTDNFGNSLGSFNPNEFAIDGCYATQLSDHFSMGVSMRFIYSNLAGRITIGGVEARPGVAGAGDLAFYYRNKFRLENKKDLQYAFGLVFSNIGNKITYTSNADRDFLPMNMRLGGSAYYDIDDYNSVGFAVDLNKLLVPTPPIYERDSTGVIVQNPDGSRKIAKGRDNVVPVLQGIMQSFNDAPNGFQEELQEIAYSFGVEYWYQKQFAIRTGYFHEHANKGDRKYLTFGIGVRYNVFGLDIAYLAPFQQRHPLQNTLRFSMLFDFAAFRGADK